MIAATALANDLPVYTCNPDDFVGIDGLEVVPVPVPDAAAGTQPRRPPPPLSREVTEEAR